MLLASRGYEGAAADVWSCGVILFELLAGYLPFNDRNLMVLYRKIAGAEYRFPHWFTESQKNLISRILNPNPKKRTTIQEIIEDKWFQTDYEPSCGREYDEKIYLDDIYAAFESNEQENGMSKSSSFINAFQLIAMSQDLDLSGLFEGHDDKKEKTRLGSKFPVNETIKKIEAAAMDVSLMVERTNSFKMKIHPKKKQKMSRCARSYYDLSAEVIEVAPTNCVIEISKSAGELTVFKEFCRSLSSLLTEKPNTSNQTQEFSIGSVNTRSTPKIERSSEEINNDEKDLRGYSSAS